MAFSMEVTNTDAIKKEVLEQVQPKPEEEDKLKEIAQTNAIEIMKCDMDSLEEKRNFVKSIEEFGLDTIQQSAKKNSLLKVPVANLSRSGDEGSAISKSLLDLNREIKNLDPSVIDFTKKGFLGKMLNPIRAYFDKYQKADAVINNIIVSLDKGKSTLVNDNVTLELEEHSIRELTKKLTKEIEMGTMMDQYIENQLEQAKSNNEEESKINFIVEEILFPLRQRVMDMQQMVVVNHQGIMAIEVIRRNNKELIRGVERAKSVTVSALKIAVMVASALYNQKIVLSKIQALNETTENIISGTSKMLKEQGTEIQKQSMQSTVSVDVLKQSFEDVMSALDEISHFKQEALPQMKETITQFRELADQGEVQIQKLEKGSALDR